MKKNMVRNILVAYISFAMAHALAASASIGIATVKGSFRIDDSNVAGNATLFDGTVVETGASTGELNLSNTKLVMGIETRGQVFHDRMVLDHGKVQWNGADFRTVAGAIQIVGADGGSKALVERKGDTVQVTSLLGTVNVVTMTGESLAVLAPGAVYDFKQESAGAKPAAAVAGAAGAAAGTGTATAAGVAGVAAAHVAISATVITVTAVGVAAGAAAAVAAVRAADSNSR